MRVSATRSRTMAAIRRRDTGPEILVRRLARGLGARYRLDVGALPGRPDLANVGGRWAIFVNGCFWHDHECRGGRRPRTRRAFWGAKLDRNVLRDASAVDALRRASWRVLVLWECELRGGRGAARLRRFLG